MIVGNGVLFNNAILFRASGFSIYLAQFFISTFIYSIFSVLVLYVCIIVTFINPSGIIYTLESAQWCVVCLVVFFCTFTLLNNKRGNNTGIAALALITRQHMNVSV